MKTNHFVVFLCVIVAFGSFMLKSVGQANHTTANQSIKDTLTKLYEKKSGYTIKADEIKLIEGRGGNSTYGEILPAGLETLFKELALTHDDVFVDISSGIGKTVIYAYLATPTRKSIGIELSKTRHAIAAQAEETLKKMGKIDANRSLIFEQKDFMDADLSDATVLFMNSVFFSDEYIQKIIHKAAQGKAKLRIISTKKLPANERFELVKELVLPMSWSTSGSPINIYALKAK